jgi:acyl transferase domain-containing protein/acyl carrier protein
MSHTTADLRGDAPREGTDIAVIGMAGRFPGAPDVDAFWQNLRDGIESVAFFSDSELEAAGVDAATLRDPAFVKARGALDGVELFDAAFFGYSPREAEVMDPQHRIFLECAWEALESAGYDPTRCRELIGVYAGTSVNTYLLSHVAPNYGLATLADRLQLLVGNDKDFLTTRVSYKLNLKGPSVTVQTACSTSLVAVHLACQSLLNYECDVALAGGVSLSIPERAGYRYQEGGISSPDGHCRAFDAGARGTVGGSGAGIVVLKRLADALADGDRVRAVIKGSAINNDGSEKIGYTAPSETRQAEVIAQAHAVAGTDPETIGYIEAHGTGTALGDPIEIRALTRAFQARAVGKRTCAIGSVKTNIGHLDAAAGVAGLIKTVLALEHRLIPPSLHFKEPNPQIDFENSPFYVNSVLTDWKAGRSPRRAGVSSFGIGGTNAHVVLEEAPEATGSGASRPVHLLVLSAKTGSALEAATSRLLEHLGAHRELDLADVAYTCQAGRTAFGHRRVVVCRDLDGAVAALEGKDATRVFTAAQDGASRSVAFMFPGQGAQYPGMAAELYRIERAFRDQVDLCSELLRPSLGRDLRRLLFASELDAEEAAAVLNQTSVTQPALFVIEYALASLWASWGVRPEVMIGHSIGEYVAACLAGVMSLEDALSLVAARGRIIQGLPGGSMLAVRLAERDVRSLLDPRLSLAAINGPSGCVVSGPADAVDALEAELARQGVVARRLRTSHAFHSQMMEPALGAFLEAVKRVGLAAPKVPYISNVTGAWVTEQQATDPRYWVRHLRETVRFMDGLGELLKDPGRILLEVGPGQTLRTLVGQHPERGERHLALSSLPGPGEPREELASLLQTLGRLWLAGVQPDWAGFHANERRRRVPLPTYPFERRRYWIEPRRPRAGTPDHAAEPGKSPDVAGWFYIPSWKRSVAPRLWENRAVAQKASWLLLLDECGLGAALARRLADLGQDVVTVRAGSAFATLGHRAYAVNPGDRGDYDGLLDALRASGGVPDRIVHLWTLTRDGDARSDHERFDELQDRGFYSLVFLARALGKQGVRGALRIDVVSNDMQDVDGEDALQPEKATLLGACRVIPQEYHNISCRSVDVALPAPETEAERRLLDALLAELSSPSTDPVVAYRQTHRWVQTFEPVPLDGTAGRPSRLRHKGVYLITGGFGNVGLTLARHLAERFQARLVLLGRSELPPTGEWPQWLAAGDAGEAPGSAHLAPTTAAESRVRIDVERELDSIADQERRLDHRLAIRTIADYDGLSGTLDSLCSAYIRRYFAQSGIETRRESRYQADELKRRLGLSPQYARFYDFMLRVLAEDSIVRLDGNAVEFLSDGAAVPDPESLKARIAEAYPGFAGLVDRLDHCVSRYPDVLSGRVDPLSVLYPDGTADLLRGFERRTVEHRKSRLYQLLLRDTVTRVVRGSRPRKIRILEVGGGTGTLTALLVPVLMDENVEYHFTDVGKAFVMRAEQEALRHGLTFMKFGLLDITKDPASQGYDEYSFDVVVGLDVVHVARRIDEAVRNLSRLVAPNGLIGLVETVRAQRWDSMVEGLTREWWHFEDAEVRTDSPLLGLPDWERVLRRHGFSNVRGYPGDEARRASSDSGLVVGQQPESIGTDDYREWVAAKEREKARGIRERIRRVQELEAAGAEVLTPAADVASAEQMAEVVRQTCERFGEVHGLIHAASPGTKWFGAIHDTDRFEAEQHFRAKGHALYVLDRVVRGRPLDFCLLMSSNASILGGLGFAAYSAANAFMDAFAQKKGREGGSTRWIGTNWDGWPVVGEGRAGAARTLGTSLLRFAMTREESLDAFERVMSAGEAPQIVVSTGDLAARMRQWVGLEVLRQDARERSDGGAKAHHPRPDLHSSYVAPRNDLEQRIAAAWREVLGIDRVGVHDDFFELGGDSLLAIGLISRLRETFGVELPVRTLFEAATVAGLAAAIESSRGERAAEASRPEIERLPRAEDDVDDLLLELDRLSEEQVQSMLADEGR